LDWFFTIPSSASRFPPTITKLFDSRTDDVEGNEGNGIRLQLILLWSSSFWLFSRIYFSMKDIK
jgi:hypothetical protein